MEKQRGKATVEIFGEIYVLRGDDNPEKIIQVAEFIDKRMKQIAKNNLRLSPTRIAVLAALNLAEEYLRLETDYQELVDMINDEKCK
jgi:cell division protein ZapA